MTSTSAKLWGEPSASTEVPAADTPRTAGQARRRRAWKLLCTSWPWRFLANLLATPLTLIYLLLTTPLLPVYFSATPLIFVALAVICWPITVLVAVQLGRVERAWLGWVDLNEIDPAQPLRRVTLREWLRVHMRERSTWTVILHITLLFPLGLVNLTVLLSALGYSFMSF